MEMVHHFAALNPVTEPICSVCIANYNGVKLLGDCIESVLAQQGDFPVEIIVHDDASTDDSVAWLRKNYPQIELLASEQNVGFCISNNRMVENARGVYILLLNNDAALFPDALSVLLNVACEQTRAGILTLPQYDWTSGTLVDCGCLLDPFYNPIPNLDPKRREVAMAIGACLWIPRNLWTELEGFPEWMESIAEDLYLCCMARLQGFTVQTMDRSGFRHRLGTSFGGARIDGRNLKSTMRRRRLSERNKTFALIIFTPTLAAWALMLIHLLALLIEGLVISSIQRNLSIFRDIYVGALSALIRNRKQIRAIRTRIQRQRRVSLTTYFTAFSLMPRKLIMLFRYGIPKITK